MIDIRSYLIACFSVFVAGVVVALLVTGNLTIREKPIPLYYYCAMTQQPAGELTYIDGTIWLKNDIRTHEGLHEVKELLAQQFVPRVDSKEVIVLSLSRVGEVAE